MSSLYQINQQITEAIDLETGEIIDEAAYEALNIEKEEKLENIALFYKNTMADAEALKAEEKAFAERRKAAENKAVSLKRLLDNELAGSPFVTSRVAIGYRKSTSVNIVNEEELPKDLLVEKVSISPDKKAIGELLKNGEVVSGAELVENKNIQIKQVGEVRNEKIKSK